MVGREPGTGHRARTRPPAGKGPAPRPRAPAPRTARRPRLCVACRPAAPATVTPAVSKTGVRGERGAGRPASVCLARLYRETVGLPRSRGAHASGVGDGAKPAQPPMSRAGLDLRPALPAQAAGSACPSPALAPPTPLHRQRLAQPLPPPSLPEYSPEWAARVRLVILSPTPWVLSLVGAWRAPRRAGPPARPCPARRVVRTWKVVGASRPWWMLRTSSRGATWSTPALGQP